jgi:hypothetical protein
MLQEVAELILSCYRFWPHVPELLNRSRTWRDIPKLILSFYIFFSESLPTRTGAESSMYVVAFIFLARNPQ